jgi:hypothetical protein
MKLVWFFLGCMPSLLFAQPTAPELALNGTGRFEFATVPELTFIRGIAETQSVGMWQIDPANPWPAGQPTAGPWRSGRPTRLVDTATNQPVTMLSYAALTGEVSYAGTWSGDVTARIETLDGAVRSAPFRIRVLTPSVVFGNNAAAVNTAKGWNARVCESPAVSFLTCRTSGKFMGGSSDVAPLVIFITPGAYSGDFYIGTKRYVYVIGDPNNWPQLAGDKLANTGGEIYAVRNFKLYAARLAQLGRSSYPNNAYYSNLTQWGETKDLDGFVNPHGYTPALWSITMWNVVSRGMGSLGNTKHAMYLEGRPLSSLSINSSQFLGSNGCSSVKTTMENVAIRHSIFSVSQTIGAIDNNFLTHTPIDIPSYSSIRIYGNQFYLWRGPTVGVPTGRSGILAGAIFLRLRKPSFGSDKPSYPNRSWNPPVTSQTTGSSPCSPWGKGPEVFVDDKFWQAVKSKPITDQANACAFQHFIALNKFTMLADSMPVKVLRDDGSHPAKPLTQFGKGVPLRVSVGWVERSVDYLYGNSYDNFASTDPAVIYSLKDSEAMAPAEPGAKWPRDEPEEFPKAVDLEELPAWFKL